MKVVKQIVVACCLLVAPQVVYAIDAKTQYQSACATCHGVNGEGNAALNAPALAAQSSSYLQRQLKNYKEGVRGTHPKDMYGPQMKAMAALVGTDEKRKNMGDYLSAMPLVNKSLPSNLKNADVALGESVYQSNCGSCHGTDAKGNDALNSPSLLGMSPKYMKRQYQLFLDGARGYDKADKYGRQMKLIASGMTDLKTVDAVNAYLISIQE